MALLHRATITPTKLELVEAWAPAQPWCPGGGVAQVAAYRFDDPAGEVGIETLIVRAAGGPVLQVPLTYRGAPLEGGEPWLIGTTTHSVLGERWVYDAAGDPVAVAAFATAIRTGGVQAEIEIEIDGVMLRRDPTATVRGTGSASAPTPVPPAIATRSDERSTRIEAGGFVLTLRRVLDDAPADGEALVGIWSGSAPSVLATLA
ncbi:MULTISPECIES: CG0192-related protein [unclassified Rathayibacter]|uniref:CG0192-related protein n=1 Tax=unclassified Rathayibacter TaxID=2609250 RepID=UPI0006FD3868|nr:MULTISPECIES: hypothetical protein [unclassified Rathayibacter]KQQ00026.1 hypothetical protein ASF42_16725 [Rathayibacter sp. Leaf294]KQS09480.1 hypothetical protein ASG06_16725 [Rathayibacter sp. Leaf185]